MLRFIFPITRTARRYDKDGLCPDLPPMEVSERADDDASHVGSAMDSCPFASLPEEMVVKVLLFLSAESLFRFAATSRCVLHGSAGRLVVTCRRRM